MKEVSDILRFWNAHRGEHHALATLVATRGSSFRRQGARMLIHSDGRHVGGVSAGCIEEEVVDRAREVIASGRPVLMGFDTRRRFGCHGSIDIFVEKVQVTTMSTWHDRFRRRERVGLETVVTGERSGTRVMDSPGSPESFFQVLPPPIRIVLIGDGAELRAVQEHAAVLGWEALRMDAEQVGDLPVDDRSAVLLATHNFGRDAAALRALFPLGLRYLGLIGSRRRRDDLLFDVMHDGLAMESELFAPAGLDLGADAAEEIALSIVAEIQQVFSTTSAKHLRDCPQPIHQRDKPASCPASPV